MTFVKTKINSLKKRINKSYGIIQIKRNGFWFIDIPRTSSSSIKVELSSEFGRVYGKNNIFEKEYNSKYLINSHKTAREMKNLLGHKAWSKLYTFTIVRNPWDRIVSIYHYLKHENYIPSDLSFRDYVIKLDYEIQNNEWQYDYAPFYLGSIDFVTDENGNIIVSKIAKFEDRDSEVEEIAQKIGSKGLGNIFVQKASVKNKHYSSYYDEETKEIIERLYKQDVLVFDYKFESQQP